MRESEATKRLGRLIKFRAWIDYGPGHRMMLYDRDNLAEFFEAAEGSPIMQYTGLKDNTKWKDLTEEERKRWVQDGNLPSQWNGKEIYEGDILVEEFMGKVVVKFGFHETSTDYYAPVAYGFYGAREDGTEHTYSGEYLERAEKIGNIYENPELLNK